MDTRSSVTEMFSTSELSEDFRTSIFPEPAWMASLNTSEIDARGFTPVSLSAGTLHASVGGDKSGPAWVVNQMSGLLARPPNPVPARSVTTPNVGNTSEYPEPGFRL